MIYFDGFGVKNSENLFAHILDKFANDFSVVGFSYGAIKATQYINQTNKRVDKLVLISPAFFCDRDEKFKRVQLISYKKDKAKYIENFLKNIAFPKDVDVSLYSGESRVEELEELLYYGWEKEEIEAILSKGVKIYTFLGELDRIINSHNCVKFFSQFSEVFLYKDRGHIL